MLSKTLKNIAERLLKPMAVVIGKMGVKPNHITVMGLFLTFWAAWFIYNKDKEHSIPITAENASKR